MRVEVSYTQYLRLYQKKLRKSAIEIRSQAFGDIQKDWDVFVEDF